MSVRQDNMATKNKHNSPLLGDLDFQSKDFQAGYISHRIKLNNDPIPPYLIGTAEWRKWMDGWNRACLEVHDLKAYNKEGAQSEQ